MRYQYLLLDNDNTVMDFSAAEAKALIDLLGFFDLPTDEKTVHTYQELNEALWKALERGETTQPKLKVERFRQLLEVLGRTDIAPEDMAAKYTTMLASHPDLLPGAEDFIRALHGNVKMAIVSNGLSAIQRGRLGLCPLTPMFDAIVISEEVGVAKPDPKLIEVALDMLGCKDKSQAVMMGDSLSADIKAAVNAGVDSIFFSPKGIESDLPTYTVRNHAEALAILMEE